MFQASHPPAPAFAPLLRTCAGLHGGHCPCFFDTHDVRACLLPSRVAIHMLSLRRSGPPSFIFATIFICYACDQETVKGEQANGCKQQQTAEAAASEGTVRRQAHQPSKNRPLSPASTRGRHPCPRHRGHTGGVNFNLSVIIHPQHLMHVYGRKEFFSPCLSPRQLPSLKHSMTSFLHSTSSRYIS